MRILLVVLLLVPVLAHAEDKNVTEMRKLLDQALTGKIDEDVPATADALSIFPGKFNRGDISGWRMGPPYISGIKIVASAAAWVGQFGWIAADLAVTQRPYSDSSGAQRKPEAHRYHLLQVYVLDGKTMKVRATMLTDTVPDAKLVAGKPNPGRPTGDGSLAWKLIHPGKIQLAPDAQLAIMGSSEGEVGFGAAAAKKLLASWSKLEIKNVGQYYTIVDKDLGVVISEVDLVVKGKPVRLRGMLVTRHDNTYDKIVTKVVALSYGADTEFGDPPRP